MTGQLTLDAEAPSEVARICEQRHLERVSSSAERQTIGSEFRGQEEAEESVCPLCGSRTQRENACFFPLAGVWRVPVRCTGVNWKHTGGRLREKCPVRWVEVES